MAKATMIKCIECHKWKPKSEFRKGHKQCKSCLNEYSRKYRREHRGKIKEYTKEYRREYRQEAGKYRQKYKKESREYYKKYCKEHEEDIRKRKKEYRQKHIKEAKEYRKNHKNEAKEYQKEYSKNHKKQMQKYFREYYRVRRKNLKHRLNHSISSAINRSLKGNKNGLHWEIIVNFTQKKLKHHLEAYFLSGMTWANYGNWHIDHEIPISVFNFDSYNQLDFKRCWALSNLRPMWATENIKKSNKIDKPFQLSFKI